MRDLKLSVFDLPMLSCHYIQKGLFFPSLGNIPIHHLLSVLKTSIARALSFFPPLASRLFTDLDSTIYVACNGAGVEFSHVVALTLMLDAFLPPATLSDIPQAVKSLFAMDGAVSYQGHFRPFAAFQFTELGDGAVFIGCTINHIIVDGTSFWNFFNAWAERCRIGSAASKPSRSPVFQGCDLFCGSKAVLRLPDGKGPQVTSEANAPLREDLPFQPRCLTAAEIRGQFHHQIDPCGRQPY